YEVADLGRRLVLLAQAGIAVEYRERDEGSALMGDAAEIAVGDEVERLLATVIRMHPPSDVGEQAGGVTQPAFFLGFPDFDDPEQAIGPVDQLLRMTRRAGEQLVEVLRRAEQAVLGALELRQHFVKQAFAHAEGRKHDGLRPRYANDVF